MRPITFLSDYGVLDEFVGVCHGVIARIAPEARVLDVAHGIERHDVRGGALVLRNALPYLPAGVHLAVVDPGVGTRRRGVAVRLAEEDRLLVGPDNGLLGPATERLGGVIEAVDVSASRFRLEPASATFHGRDLFAPVAAHLAAGAELAEAGEPVDPDSLAVLELPVPRFDGGTLIVHALYADRFGNVALDVSHHELSAAGLKLGASVEIERDGERHGGRYARTFADVAPGELLLYEDAHRTLALAINRGDAAAELGIERDAELRIQPSR
jgi:S-adenosyl-L-methionine hydrolase (adenosine-forming)